LLRSRMDTPIARMRPQRIGTYPAKLLDAVAYLHEPYWGFEVGDWGVDTIHKIG
jgi:hypothetical protein